MPDDRPPHYYIPSGPLETVPGGGYRDPETRREAFAAVLAGVPLGAYDNRILDWLCGLDDDTCRTVASLLWRARLAGRAEAVPVGAVTEWSVTRDALVGISEDAAKAVVQYARERGKPVTLYRRQLPPWTEAPETESREDES